MQLIVELMSHTSSIIANSKGKKKNPKMKTENKH